MSTIAVASPPRPRGRNRAESWLTDDKVVDRKKVSPFSTTFNGDFLIRFALAQLLGVSERESAPFPATSTLAHLPHRAARSVGFYDNFEGCGEGSVGADGTVPSLEV